MTDGATWIGIAGADLNEIRELVAAGKAKWTDDDVVMRLFFDLVAGVVGLSEEMRSEHEEALKVWREVQQPVARARGEGSSAPEGRSSVDRAPEVRQEAVPADGRERA